MEDLKHRTIRGGFAKICSQGAILALRLGSLMVLGRRLEPADFGLVGMVLAVIGVLDLFKDFGLSTAAVQRATITTEQHSTLFWVNMLAGAILGAVALGGAPVMARFYHEPRLLAVTSVLALGFLFNAAGVQHGAMLQRQLRFTTIAVIETVCLMAGVAVAIAMAYRGFGYWAIVAMTIVPPLVSTICLWAVTGWVPGMPRRDIGLGPILRFGSMITLNGFIVYVAYNFEKVLLGRFWGAEVLGIYGRAYQLVNIPTATLNSAAGSVAFASLSRVRDEPERFKSYFLKGYSLILALTIPITIVCAIFAEDLILVLLGPKWTGAAAVFRLLAPTILIFALINPLAWLIFALGMVSRALKIALVMAPLVIFSYLIGLSHGPKGVALGYSVVMALWVVPHIAWCVQGTVVSLRDIMAALSRPLLSGVAAAVLPLAFLLLFGAALSPLPTLVLGGSLFAAGYLVMLMGVMGQKAFYLNLLRDLRRRAVGAKELVSA